MVDYLVDFEGTFDAAAEGNSPRNAYLLALASNLAYSGGAEACAITHLWGFDRKAFEFFDSEGSQGFYAQSARLALVAFRGTGSLKDWRYNLRAKPVAGPVGQVHAGFQQALGAIYGRVAARVKARPAGVPVWVTGHSLGGAMARICAARLHFVEGHSPAGLYTYGQPRAGDLEFTLRFETELGGRTFRYVNDNDIVPHVPPHGFGYRHEHERFFFDADGRLNVDTDPFEEALDRRDLRAVAADVSNTLELFRKDFDGVVDHMMDRYLANLAGAAALARATSAGVRE